MTQAPPVATTPRNYPIFTVRWLALHTLGIPTVEFPIAILMAHRLCPGEAAGPKAFFPSGLLPLQVEWLFFSLWASFSTAPTPVLVPPD